jgi:hypothetical protein
MTEEHAFAADQGQKSALIILPVSGPNDPALLPFPADVAGVAVYAEPDLPSLAAELREREAQIGRQQSQISAQQSEIDALHAKVSEQEKRLEGIAATVATFPAEAVLPDSGVSEQAGVEPAGAR